MSEIKLKSKLIKVCDYENIDLSEYAIPLREDPAITKMYTDNFMRRFAKKINATEIAKDDLVTLSCKSGITKFNKEQLTLRVGLGLFSREFEDMLIGLKKGETKTLIMKDGEADVHISEITREILPPLTDEMAQSCGIRGVRTVRDIYDYCRGKQYEEALEIPADDAMILISSEMNSNSTFYLDETEVAAAKKAIAGIIEKLNEVLTESGKSSAEADTMSDGMLKNAVFGYSMLEKDGALLTTDDYETYINGMATGMGISPKEAREKESMLEYALNEYGSRFTDAVTDYAVRRLQHLGESMTLNAEK